MIVRHRDALLHNLIANDPSVRPTFGYHEGYTDLTPLVDMPETYVLLSNGRNAASIWEWSAPDVWQGHSIFLPEARGRTGIDAGRQMCRYMFDEIGAKMLWGMTPLTHRPAQLFNRLLGFQEAGTGVDAADIEVRYFVLER